jgi:phosphoribosylanthranilate isomerase
MIVQVYGITTPDDARVVVEAGADHVGVVLDEGFGTWDSVDETAARHILTELADDVTTVGLSLATGADAIRRTIDTLTPDIAHVVNVTEHWQPDEVARLRDTIAPIALMLTVAVRDPNAVETARRFAEVCDYVLLDSANPATGVVGASGLTHDWLISRAIVDAVPVPVVLAGGLGPENVAAAIDAVRPAGVDSETRTSRDDDRRRKDPERVRRFVEQARRYGAAASGSSNGTT